MSIVTTICANMHSSVVRKTAYGVVAHVQKLCHFCKDCVWEFGVLDTFLRWCNSSVLLCLKSGTQLNAQDFTM